MISNVLKGGDIIQVAVTLPRFTQLVVVKSEIKKPSDLAGKRIGMSRLGKVTHFALQSALDAYGIKGVSIPQMGGQPEEVTGLIRGVIDGAVLSPPYNFQLKRQGFNELVRKTICKSSVQSLSRTGSPRAEAPWKKTKSRYSA